MKRFRLAALLTVVSILTMSGVGGSAGPVNGNVTLMDFEQNQQTLLGYPWGQPPLGWYKRTSATAHVLAVLNPNAPPNPCKALSQVWNLVITKVPAGKARDNALRVVLRAMAKKECRADISRDETQNPAPINQIRPTP
jgi:hypothetical protein